MRRLLPGLLSLVLLAACVGQSAPSATPEPPTAETGGATPVATVEGQAAQLLPTGVAETMGAPLPGTLVTASTTGTANPPTRPPFTINIVSYYQQGGVSGTPLNIALYGDGRLIRDGVESRVSPEEVDAIAAMLSEMDFLGIQGVFTAAGRAPDLFQYTITVETPFGSQTLTTQDGLTPDPLLALYAAIRALGQAVTQEAPG
ncbi:MAG: hypothetical protein IPK19_23480 [Chloroflexi bacterium]|nr:hypothetical protein [Chloroflexota bacterium]